MIDVSICICTFRRPEGLRRLLCSIANLDPGSPSYEVIVADNDAAGSGEAVVAEARAAGLPVQYVIEPVRGIARARNRSVAPARGEFVAFVDDDEEPDPQWLVQMHGEVTRHGADGGVGPVVPRFNERTPAWLIEGGFFDRRRVKTGTVLGQADVRTGNALIRRRHLSALSGPFDEHYALSGGEDTDLFLRLFANQCRIIAVDSAIVWEHLPPNRTTVSYLLRRRFLTGLGTAKVYAETTPGIRPAEQRVRWLAAGIAGGVVGVLIFPAARARGMDRLVVAARDFGRFAFYSGYTYHPYGQDSWR